MCNEPLKRKFDTFYVDMIEKDEKNNKEQLKVEPKKNITLSYDGGH